MRTIVLNIIDPIQLNSDQEYFSALEQYKRWDLSGNYYQDEMKQLKKRLDMYESKLYERSKNKIWNT